MSAKLESLPLCARLFGRSAPGARQATRSTNLLKTALASFEHTQIPDWELFPGVHLWRSCAVQQLEEEGIGITLTWETEPVVLAGSDWRVGRLLQLPHPLATSVVRSRFSHLTEKEVFLGC